MKRYTKRIAALTIVFAAVVMVYQVQAQEPTPAGEGDAAVVVAEPAQVVESGCCDVCAHKYCISYRKLHVRRKVCCGCCVEPYTTMLTVNDPCSCCPIEVPVCVPGCCTDAPSVSCRRGLFGRMIYTYTWCCGYTAKITLSTRRGTILVTTYGS